MIPTAETITIGAVFLYFVNEFFKYLKTRKNENSKIDKGDIKAFTKDITEINTDITRIDTVLSNHISHLREDMIDVKRDVGIMKNSLEDIKIALSKK